MEVFADPKWDINDPKDLESQLLQQFQLQLKYAAEKSPFWKKRLPAPLLKQNTLSRADIETLPLLNKQLLRLVDPLDLLTDTQASYYLVRGSSGTTGLPVNIFWSYEDWRASVGPATRFLARARNWEKLRVWNGYNQGHIAGPAFDDFLRSVGATPIPRHFKSTEQEAIEEMEWLKIDAIVLTPQGGSGKGGSLEDFLTFDPSFISRIGANNLLVSSTELKDELLDEVYELGVQTIVNLYGSTEALPTGISCLNDPQSFHICNGHIFLEVIDNEGHHVAPGERGTIVVSRIGSSYASGIGRVKGTQLFRFIVGDTALFLGRDCPCGLTTPRIAQIARLPADDTKIQGGCEQWD